MSDKKIPIKRNFEKSTVDRYLDLSVCPSQTLDVLTVDVKILEDHSLLLSAYDFARSITIL
jgi:hypothetical protein